MELMHLSKVAELVGQHVQSVRRMTWARTDSFPQAVSLSKRTPAVRGVWYLAHEIRDWEKRRAIRDATAEAMNRKLRGRPATGRAKAQVKTPAVAPVETPGV